MSCRNKYFVLKEAISGLNQQIILLTSVQGAMISMKVPSQDWRVAVMWQETRLDSEKYTNY